jgi:hypothetical protein
MLDCVYIYIGIVNYEQGAPATSPMCVCGEPQYMLLEIFSVLFTLLTWMCCVLELVDM